MVIADYFPNKSVTRVLKRFIPQEEGVVFGAVISGLRPASSPVHVLYKGLTRGCKAWFGPDARFAQRHRFGDGGGYGTRDEPQLVVDTLGAGDVSASVFGAREQTAQNCLL